MKNKGLHQYRFKDNPEERRFAKAWDEQNYSRTHDTLTYLLHTGNHGGGIYMKPPTDREREVAATIIQWLGTPVGQCFLSDLGYERKTKR